MLGGEPLFEGRSVPSGTRGATRAARTVTGKASVSTDATVRGVAKRFDRQQAESAAQVRDVLFSNVITIIASHRDVRGTMRRMKRVFATASVRVSTLILAQEVRTGHVTHGVSSPKTRVSSTPCVRRET